MRIIFDTSSIFEFIWSSCRRVIHCFPKRRTRSKREQNLLIRVLIAMSLYSVIVFYLGTICHNSVPLQFKNDDRSNGFYHAHVSPAKKLKPLLIGQPYDISINIDMAETEENIQLGMFMVCGEMRGKEMDQHNQYYKILVYDRSCRSAMLRHRSNLNRAIMRLLFMLGLVDETQQIPIELFPDYKANLSSPVTEIYVEIQTKEIQFYSIRMHITAQVPELFLFHWKAMTLFIVIVLYASWTLIQLYQLNKEEDAKEKTRALVIETHHKPSSLLPSAKEERSDEVFTRSENEDISIIDEKSLFSMNRMDDIELGTYNDPMCVLRIPNKRKLIPHSPL